MLIFLYGPDIYRSRQKLNEVISHYKKIHKSGLNLKFFDGERLDFQDFQEEIKTVSMFAEKKLIVLENALKNKSFKESFLANAKKFLKSDDVILFYEGTNEVSANDSLAKHLKKSGKSQEFKLLDGQKLKNWAKKEFSNYNAEVDPAVLERLIEFAGEDLWQLSNEIKKLIDYKNKKKIALEDIELLVKPRIAGTDIFKTIDSLAQRDKKQALKLIHQHLEKGDHPLYLLSMINFQFRNLLIIKDLSQKYQSPYAISKITKLHPYVVKKSYPQAQRFTVSELKKIYQKIFEVDVSLKTGKMEPETALDLLIASI